jgi:hypothetical protein
MQHRSRCHSANSTGTSGPAGSGADGASPGKAARKAPRAGWRRHIAVERGCHFERIGVREMVELGRCLFNLVGASMPGHASLKCYRVHILGPNSALNGSAGPSDKRIGGNSPQRLFVFGKNCRRVGLHVRLTRPAPIGRRRILSQNQPLAGTCVFPAASRIRFAIVSGWEIIERWLAFTSIVFAPIRFVMNRSRSGLIVRASVDTAY